MAKHKRHDGAAPSQTLTDRPKTVEKPEVGTRLSAAEIHDNILGPAEDEMERSAGALLCSAVASGLTRRTRSSRSFHSCTDIATLRKLLRLWALLLVGNLLGTAVLAFVMSRAPVLHDADLHARILAVSRASTSDGVRFTTVRAISREPRRCIAGWGSPSGS